MKPPTSFKWTQPNHENRSEATLSTQQHHQSLVDTVAIHSCPFRTTWREALSLARNPRAKPSVGAAPPRCEKPRNIFWNVSDAISFEVSPCPIEAIQIASTNGIRNCHLFLLAHTPLSCFEDIFIYWSNDLKHLPCPQSISLSIFSKCVPSKTTPSIASINCETIPDMGNVPDGTIYFSSSKVMQCSMPQFRVPQHNHAGEYRMRWLKSVYSWACAALRMSLQVKLTINLNQFFGWLMWQLIGAAVWFSEIKIRLLENILNQIRSHF